VEQELLTLPKCLSSPPVFSGVRVTRSLVLCLCFEDRRLFFCLFSFWPLCCLSFDIWILITSLVSSNSSYKTELSFFFSFSFNNVISFIQMLATINTPKVQAPFGVSLLHLVLIIQGYNQNYMKYRAILVMTLNP
jgi:hypothetical protein